MNTSELKFPVTCHFRVIAENQEPMLMVIETVLWELGINNPVVQANTSAKGKYVSFSVSVVVNSKERMEQIDRELRNIQGVKMVL